MVRLVRPFPKDVKKWRIVVPKPLKTSGRYTASSRFMGAGGIRKTSCSRIAMSGRVYGGCECAAARAATDRMGVMAGGKHSPALFELLRDKTGTREGSPRPAAPAVPRPVVQASVPAPVRPVVERGEESSAPVGPQAIDFKRPVTVTMFSVWLAVAGVIVVGLVLWMAAYKLGFNKGEGKAIKDLGGTISPNGGAITEPLRNEPIPVNPRLITKSPPAPKPPEGGGENKPAAPVTPAAGDGQRVAGLNYLVIATKLDKETADRAAGFLTENGVPALVVRSGGAANNTPSYTLYGQQGITREQLRARDPVRTELEAKVAKLGKTWQKEHKGRTDFSQTYWEKFGS